MQIELACLRRVCMSMKWGEIGGTISTVKISKRWGSSHPRSSVLSRFYCRVDCFERSGQFWCSALQSTLWWKSFRSFFFFSQLSKTSSDCRRIVWNSCQISVSIKFCARIRKRWKTRLFSFLVFFLYRTFWGSPPGTYCSDTYFFRII